MSYIDQQMSRYIHLSKYSRWLPDVKRRETWEETVDRLINFWRGRFGDVLGEDLFVELRQSTVNLGVMPSMRTLMTAGPALDRDEAAGFNCAGAGINHLRYFDEIFYLLMCGTGVGFSVESKYVSQLPTISEDFHPTETVIRVHDSKIGWAKGLKQLISLLVNGEIPTWDLSYIRPAGARLKTFGGRASGPEPLDKLFKMVVKIFTNSAGRKLTPLEVHDLICWIAMTVIVGSVRRSACISISDLMDMAMARAKTGEWWKTYEEGGQEQRKLSNNSAAYYIKPDVVAFNKEFMNLFKSYSGERGIVNKTALKKKAEACGREWSGDYLLNPCGEAILRDTGGFCNLSEVVIRPEDTFEDLRRKVRLATIYGTLQSSLTKFRYLRKVWQRNQEEERLLGVSLTGIMDHPIMSGAREPDADFLEGSEEYLIFDLSDVLANLRAEAQLVNQDLADVLGIPYAKQITLVKPSGTVSQLCGTSSGIHPQYAPYYLRRVTQDNKDPLTDLMIAQGIPHKRGDDKTWFSFPIAAPESTKVFASNLDPIDALELWKTYSDHWSDGNPSCTIYYRDNNFFEVMSWVYKNFDDIGGLSFFPLSDGIYDKETQPYLPITKEEYEAAVEAFPKDINWDMTGLEEEDNTTGMQEYACAGDKCSL